MEVNVAKMNASVTRLSPNITDYGRTKYVWSEWPESTYVLIGILMTALSVKGVLTSLIFFKVLASNKKYINSSFIYLPVLIGLALVLSAGILPINAVSAFDRDFRLARTACNVYGFVITWLGLMFILCLTVMVVQSYRIVASSRDAVNTCNIRSFVYSLVACIVVCGLSAAMPLFGIAEYEAHTRPALCHLSWKVKSSFEACYLISLIVMYFVIPVTIITVLYGRIIIKVRMSSRILSHSQIRCKRLICTAIITTVSFISSWSPYVVCAVMDLVGYKHTQTLPSFYTASSIIAKISFTWIPAIIMFCHRHYKQDLVQLNEALTEKITETIHTTSSQEYNLDHSNAIDEGVIALDEYSTASNFDQVVTLLHYKKIPT